MKVRVLLVAALALAGAWTPSHAAAPYTATRGITVLYSGAGGLAGGVLGSGSLTKPGDWQQAVGNEDHVGVAAHDDGGVPIAVRIDYTGSDGPMSLVTCSGTTLRIAPKSQLRVTPVLGQCPDSSISLPTSGGIGITFIRPLPRPISKVIPADRRWAVIIGITDYAGNTHSTLGGTGDAAAIQKGLLASGWRADHLLVLKDSQATGQAIIDAMAWLAARSGPTTYSLFHFSGHACIASRGPCASGHTYLWGYDNRFVPETTVTSVLGRVKGPAWFDFAACESGAFDNGLHSSLRMVTAASQAHETAYEVPDWRQSVWSGLVFDRAFNRGLDGYAPYRSTVAQMVSYGRSQAPVVTGNQSAGAQHPYASGGLAGQSLFAPHY